VRSAVKSGVVVVRRAVTVHPVINPSMGQEGTCYASLYLIVSARCAVCLNVLGYCTAYRVRQSVWCRLVADHDARRESLYMYTCSTRSYNRSEITWRISNVGQQIPDSPYRSRIRCREPFPQEIIEANNRVISHRAEARVAEAFPFCRGWLQSNRV
jgi:hypothetical protein